MKILLILLASMCACIGQPFTFGDIANRSAGGTNTTSPGGGGSPGLLTYGYWTNNGAKSYNAVSNITVSGSGKLMLATFGWWVSGGGSVSSVTWGDQNFTKVHGTNYYDTTGKAEVWKLLNPDSETTNVVVTWAANVDESCLGVAVITNANQSDTFREWVVTYYGSSVQFHTNMLTSASGELCYSAIVWDGTDTYLTNAVDETLSFFIRQPGRTSPGLAWKLSDSASEETVWNTSGLVRMSHFSVSVKP